MENLYPKHGLVSRTYSKKSLIMASIFGSKSKSFMTMSIPSQDEPLTNWPMNDPRDFAKPVKVIALPQDVLSTSDHCLIELETQVQHLIETYLALTQPSKACVNYTSSRMNKMGSKRFTPNQGQRSFNDAANTWKEKPNFNWAHTQALTSPQGETQIEQQQDDMIGKINLLWKTVSEKHNNVSTPENAGNTMAPNRIIAISHDEKEELGKRDSDSDTEEEGISSNNEHEHELDDMIRRREEVKEQGKEGGKIKTDMVVEEVIKEEEDSKFEIDEEVEELFKEEEDEDEDDEGFNLFPSMKEFSHHEWLLKRPRPLSIIDHHLREMVIEKPFLEETGLIYSKEKGTVMFEQGNGKITFKIPYNIEIFKQTRLMGFSIDSIPPSAHEENFGHEKTHYYQSLLIGEEYKQDKGSGYQQKGRKPSQNDKTEHGMEKTVQNQGQSPKMPKSESILKNQQSNRSRN
ncbi:hypothetical protein Tco_1368393 [Tanacetum coccineum]